MIRTAFLLLIAISTAAASQTQTLRVDVQLSQIVATVTDARGHLITDLSADDFVVEADGVRQNIAHFTQDADTPIGLGLLLDLSGSMVSRLHAVKETGSVFIKSMRPDDEYFIMTFATSTKMVQNLTHDRDRLVDALNGIEGGGGSTQLLTATLKAAVNLHKSANKKRALVVITDGVDTECKMNDPEFQRKLGESEVLAYGIRISASPVYSPPTRMPPIIGRPGNRCTTSPGANRYFELLQSETGGRSFSPHPDARTFDLDLEMIFDQISEELRGQYTIGIYPPATGNSSNAVISVRTKNPDYKVRTRRVVVGH